MSEEKKSILLLRRARALAFEMIEHADRTGDFLLERAGAGVLGAVSEGLGNGSER